MSLSLYDLRVKLMTDIVWIRIANKDGYADRIDDDIISQEYYYNNHPYDNWRDWALDHSDFKCVYLKLLTSAISSYDIELMRCFLVNQMHLIL
jgi:hypothetical protein